MRHNTNEDISAIVHTPVLWQEISDYIENSKFKGRGLLADCTLGEGGHSELYLTKFPELKIVAFERDIEILKKAEKRLEPFKDRIELINDNFSEISKHLQGKGEINYLLYDFGISSFHYEQSGRGFTYSKDEPLDMRLSADQDLTAFDVVNSYIEKDLSDIIRDFGEDSWHQKIASVICSERKIKKIETASELASIILRAIPKKFHVKNIHPATRVFQALRIEVNDELSSIEKSLEDSFGFLSSGGRIMAISFHSLEDRIVKNMFKKFAGLSIVDTNEQKGAGPKYVMDIRRPVKHEKKAILLTKKPVTPSQDELNTNRRSRSSKLRVCEKI
jgi:16S rRNA (cytosine1402-N4)-methyltransferase